MQYAIEVQGAKPLTWEKYRGLYGPLAMIDPNNEDDPWDYLAFQKNDHPGTTTAVTQAELRYSIQRRNVEGAELGGLAKSLQPAHYLTLREILLDPKSSKIEKNLAMEAIEKLRLEEYAHVQPLKEPASDKEMEKWLKEMDDDSYDTRLAAFKKFLSLPRKQHAQVVAFLKSKFDRASDEVKDSSTKLISMLVPEEPSLKEWCTNFVKESIEGSAAKNGDTPSVIQEMKKKNVRENGVAPNAGPLPEKGHPAGSASEKR